MTFYSLLQDILPKMTINIRLKWEIRIKIVTLLFKRSFPRFRFHFDGRPKMLIYRQISPKFFSIQTVSQKIQVSQAQSNRFVFYEATYKRQGRVLLHTSDMNRVKRVRNSCAQLWCECSFFCNYYCVK